MDPSARPASASFPSQERYRPPVDVEGVIVTVDGVRCNGEVIARNGPRTHVRYANEGSTYRRWVDAQDVTPA